MGAALRSQSATHTAQISVTLFAELFSQDAGAPSMPVIDHMPLEIESTDE
jgi:hypothetical protein